MSKQNDIIYANIACCHLIYLCQQKYPQAGTSKNTQKIPASAFPACCKASTLLCPSLKHDPVSSCSPLLSHHVAGDQEMFLLAWRLLLFGLLSGSLATRVVRACGFFFLFAKNNALRPKENWKKIFFFWRGTRMVKSFQLWLWNKTFSVNRNRLHLVNKCFPVQRYGKYMQNEQTVQRWIT